ncbi:hypothetical protein LIER_31607 [Lithospermum erythrorhizon]|uniref:Uncharacterized protein n=1 Tax=Lithospermum erythrorhizon TaxID=34254 RepID=A0AAV3RTR0_LITER
MEKPLSLRGGLTRRPPRTLSWRWTSWWKVSQIFPNPFPHEVFCYKYVLIKAGLSEVLDKFLNLGLFPPKKPKKTLTLKVVKPSQIPSVLPIAHVTSLPQVADLPPVHISLPDRSTSGPIRESNASPPRVISPQASPSRGDPSTSDSKFIGSPIHFPQA